MLSVCEGRVLQKPAECRPSYGAGLGRLSCATAAHLPPRCKPSRPLAVCERLKQAHAVQAQAPAGMLQRKAAYNVTASCALQQAALRASSGTATRSPPGAAGSSRRRRGSGAARSGSSAGMGCFRGAPYRRTDTHAAFVRPGRACIIGCCGLHPRGPCVWAGHSWNGLYLRAIVAVISWPLQCFRVMLG